MNEFKVFFKIFFLFLVLISISIVLFIFLLSPASSALTSQAIEISIGSGFSDIAKNLYEQKIIKSLYAFMLYGVFSGSAHELKPGNYILNAGSSTPAIMRIIAKGPDVDEEVTFPEGVTLKDIDFILSQKGIFPSGTLVRLPLADLASSYEFLQGVKSLEGFLFPDTYRFFLAKDSFASGGKNSSAEAVIRKFLDNFKNKAWPSIKNQKDFKDKLIIASLLEKEVPDFKDRQMVAGILYSRLSLGVPLQIDATIIYAKCSGAFLTCDNPRILRKDLGFKSIYNTYLYNDLPPTPIGNPGIDSIKAALNPLASDYFYYLSDPKTKKTIFSKTLEEHNENRARYIGG